MALINNYPYSDFENINLDWLIRIVKEYVEKTDKVVIDMAELKKYVDDYFDNLDIQDEVDNKLQEMYDNGDLAVLIAQFLNANVLLSFTDISQMKSVVGIIAAGSCCITMGASSYNDGDTGLYYVRNLSISDNIDDYNLVSFTNFPTLVAERVNKKPDWTRLKGKTCILIGDSYLGGVGATHGWGYYLQNKYGCTCYEYVGSGGGFLATGSGNKKMGDLLNDAYSDHGGDEIDFIITVAGYNDYTAAYNAQLLTNIRNFGSNLKTYFPHAEWYYFTNSGRLGTYRTTAYNGYARDAYNLMINTLIAAGVKCSKELIWWTYHDDALCYANDNVHLSDAGYELYADLINSFINGGDITYHAILQTPVSTLQDSDSNDYMSASITGLMCSMDGPMVHLGWVSWVTAKAIVSSNQVINVSRKITPPYNQYLASGIGAIGNLLMLAGVADGRTDGYIRLIESGANSGASVRLSAIYSVEV